MRSRKITPADNISPVPLLTYCIESFMPFEIWGFSPAIKFFAPCRPGPTSIQSGKPGTGRGAIPTLIYNSEKCRVMFQFEPSGYSFNYGIYISYGRLHAPDDRPIMKWKKEECYCWHSIGMSTLAFLNQMPATEFAKDTRQFYQELVEEIDIDSLRLFEKDLEKRGFESINTAYMIPPLKLHTALWNKYGNAIFNLYDLGNAERWLEYRKFLEEVDNITGMSASLRLSDPPLWKVC